MPAAHSWFLLPVLLAILCTCLAPAAGQATPRPTRRPRVEENPCRDQPDGSYQKHPLGCAYFFLCIKGNVNTSKCPPMLAFNPDNPPCDLAATVGCVLDATTTTRPRRSTTTTSTTTTTTTTTTTPAPTTTSPATTTTTTPIPSTTTTTTTTPRPTTTATTSTTPTPTPPPETTTTSTPAPTTTTTTSTLPQLPTYFYPPTPSPTLPFSPTTAESGPESPIESGLITCPAVEDETSVRFVSSNENCSQYYICYHNHPLRMHCADGLHWNHRTHQCDLRERAACTIRTVASSFPVCPRDIAVGLYAHPHRCDQFLFCKHGHMSLQQCPFYYHFDVDLKRCALRTVAKCGVQSGSSEDFQPHRPEYEYDGGF